MFNLSPFEKWQDLQGKQDLYHKPGSSDKNARHSPQEKTAYEVDKAAILLKNRILGKRQSSLPKVSGSKLRALTEETQILKESFENVKSSGLDNFFKDFANDFIEFEEMEIDTIFKYTPEHIDKRRDDLAATFGNKTANLMIMKQIFDGVPDVSIPSFRGIEHSAIEKHLKRQIPDFDSLWQNFCSEYRRNGDLEKCQPILEKIQNEILSAFDTFLSPAINRMAILNQPLMVRSTGMEDSLTLDLFQNWHFKII